MLKPNEFILLNDENIESKYIINYNISFYFVFQKDIL